MILNFNKIIYKNIIKVEEGQIIVLLALLHNFEQMLHIHRMDKEDF